MASQRICSVEGCDKPHKAYGYCESHYKRLQNCKPPPFPVRQCSVPSCSRPHKGNGYCEPHNRRWCRTGDPLGSVPRRKNPPTICAIDGCKNPAKTRGWCRGHYTKWWRYGDPLIDLRPNQGKAIPWLHDHAKHKEKDCLIWPFKRDKKSGMGCVLFDRTHMSASRAMCILVYGEPPTPKHQAAHSCGRAHEGCVNPNHLRWALPYENHQDCIKHGTRKLLTLEQKSEIKRLADTMTVQEIARKYDFASSSISHFLSGNRDPKYK